jgi:hypothetical protein
MKIDGIIFTDTFTDGALLFFQIKTLFVNVGNKWNRLGKIDMDGLVI